MAGNRASGDPAKPAGAQAVAHATHLHAAWRQARRVVVAVVGGTVALVGVALIFLPGPAFVVIPAGLAILASEFVWARRLLRHARRQGKAWGRRVLGKSTATPSKEAARHDHSPPADEPSP